MNSEGSGSRDLIALRGARLLIIGAGSGIGRATAEIAAGAGAKLAILDRNAAELENVGRSVGAFARAADLTDGFGLRRAIEQAGDHLGAIDGLLITAGIGSMTPFEQLSDDDWDAIIAVNLTGCFKACKAALPYLKKPDNAAIVMVASATGLLPSAPGLCAYAASKSGLIGFSRALSQELAPAIRVNTVCPGPVDTPLLPEAFRERLRQPGSGYPMKRAAEADEVARLILFLASSAASYINGSNIAIDGGRSMH